MNSRKIIVLISRHFFCIFHILGSGINDMWHGCQITTYYLLYLEIFWDAKRDLGEGVETSTKAMIQSHMFPREIFYPREVSYPRTGYTPGELCLKVVDRDMGGTMGAYSQFSGSEPWWAASVPKPTKWELFSKEGLVLSPLPLVWCVSPLLWCVMVGT